MRSISPFDATPQPAPRRGARIVSLTALALACTSDEVSLGGGDNPSGGSGACVLGVGGVVEDDVQASTQAELDELDGCSEITGSLRITASRGLDLAPLASLRLVRGRLDIQAPDASHPLDNLAGLDALERVGELFLIGLDITSLAPLRNLTQVTLDPLQNGQGFSTIYVSNCNRLVDLTGLENLVVWDEFYLANVAALESLRGLVTNRENQTLDVNHAPNLRDAANLGGSVRLKKVRLIDTGIESFVLAQPLSLDRLELADNPALVNVEGLGAVQSVEELIIHNNDRLEQLPELPYLGVNLAFLSILDNGALRSVPAWIAPDDGDFLPPDNLGNPGSGTFYFPVPEFHMAEIIGNAQLSELALPTSFRFGGRVRIHDNPMLTTIDLSFLAAANLLSIDHNAALEHVNIPVLDTVNELHVVNNPSLPPSLFDAVRTFSTEMQGNLDAATP